METCKICGATPGEGEAVCQTRAAAVDSTKENPFGCPNLIEAEIKDAPQSPAPAQSVGMREALRPFAEISLWRDMYPDAKEDFLTARQLQGYIKVEDVRRARAAFASQPSPAATVETDIDALTGTADDQGMFASHEGSSAATVGCGTPGCTDASCDYGKGPLRCQSCGAVVVGEPQTAREPDALGLYDLGESFLAEYERAVKDGALPDFVCAESPVEVIWHLINQVDDLHKALEPFAAVAISDIGQDETDADTFQPMRSGYNKAALITVGDMRLAASMVTRPHLARGE